MNPSYSFGFHLIHYESILLIWSASYSFGIHHVDLEHMQRTQATSQHSRAYMHHRGSAYTHRFRSITINKVHGSRLVEALAT